MAIANGLIQNPSITGVQPGNSSFLQTLISRGLIPQPQAQQMPAPQQAQGMPMNPMQGGPYQMLAEQMARGQSPTNFQNPLMPQNVNPWLLGRPG